MRAKAVAERAVIDSPLHTPCSRRRWSTRRRSVPGPAAADVAAPGDADPRRRPGVISADVVRGRGRLHPGGAAGRRGRRESVGARYELAGPQTLSHRALVSTALESFGRHRPVVGVPEGAVRRGLRLVELIGARRRFATYDEAQLMDISMVSPRGTADAERLGVLPRPMARAGHWLTAGARQIAASGASGARRSAHGSADSSCGASASRAPRRAARPISCTRGRQPVVAVVQRQRDRRQTGDVDDRRVRDEQAAAPVVIPRVGAEAVDLADPQRALGERRRQHRVEGRQGHHDRAPPTPAACSELGQRVLAARASSHIAQDSGSTSSSAASRPASWPPISTGSETCGPNAGEVGKQVLAGPRRFDLITSWPSDSSSSAASRAARSHSGSSSRVEQRRGQRDRSAAARAAGAAAANGSAAAAPRSRRRARSRPAGRARRRVSATVRVSTPSTTRKLSPASGPTETRPRAGLEPHEAAAGGGMRSRAAAVVAVRDRHHARRRPRPPSRRSSRPACGRGPTGCGSGRTAATRSSAGSRSPAARSCRRSRSRPRAAGGPGTRRPGRRGRRTDRCTSSAASPRRPVVLDRDRHAREGRGSPGPISSAAARAASCGDVGEGVDLRLELVDRARSEPRPARAAVSSPWRTSAASSSTGGTSGGAHRGASLRSLGRTDLRAAARSRSTMMSATAEVQSGLEGVVAFATEIAEPDREGGALRYRGVDIEELVGKVPFEQVWGLLVDGKLQPGLPPAEPHPLHVHSGDPRVDVQAALAMLGPQWGFGAADRHLRRGGARQPGARVGDGAVVRRPVGPRDRQAAGPAARGRQGRPRSPSAS